MHFFFKNLFCVHFIVDVRLYELDGGVLISVAPWGCNPWEQETKLAAGGDEARVQGIVAALTVWC